VLILGIVFFVIISIISILINIVYNINILYYFQLDGYDIKVLACRFYNQIKKYFVLYILLLMITLLFYFLNFNKYIICSFLSILLTIQLCFSLKNNNCFKKIKYTKRLIRLFLISIVVFLLFLLLTCFLYSDLLYFIFVLLVGVFSCISIFLSYFILYPLDIIIANYYIKKATNKLNSNSSLVKIAVTGSYGKTSTKQILSSILNEEFLTLATPKSYNTPLGISKCINVDLDNSHEVFVCEMGAKKVGEINYLCNTII